MENLLVVDCYKIGVLDSGPPNFKRASRKATISHDIIELGQVCLIRQLVILEDCDLLGVRSHSLIGSDDARRDFDCRLINILLLFNRLFLDIIILNSNMRGRSLHRRVGTLGIDTSDTVGTS